MDIISRPIQYCLIALVDGYQGLIKPWLSSCCRYQPTCSEYAKICLRGMPVHRAVFAILCRLISCNPFVRGGVSLPETRANKVRKTL